jgi:hypothetical protein
MPQPDMADAWYYADKDRPVGPLTLPYLKAILSKVSHGRDILVWREGYSEWQRAGSVSEIAAVFVGPPAIPKEQSGQEAAPVKSLIRPPPKKWSIPKVLGTIGVFAAIILGMAFGKVIGKSAYQLATQPSAATLAEKIEEGLSKGAEQLRATLPKKVDDVTTLTWVTHEGSKMIYGNRLELEGTQIDNAAKGRIREIVTKNVCKNGEMRKVLDLGGSYRYVYTDNKAKPVLTVDISSSNCS